MHADGLLDVTTARSGSFVTCELRASSCLCGKVFSLLVLRYCTYSVPGSTAVRYIIYICRMHRTALDVVPLSCDRRPDGTGLDSRHRLTRLDSHARHLDLTLDFVTSGVPAGRVPGSWMLESWNTY